MDVLVTGATGFVGSHLCAALVRAGHDVRAMTRNPDSYEGPGVAVGGDVGDPVSLGAALEGCEAAYYLVHSLSSLDFADRDRRGAEAFGDAASRAGLRQVVYLGGLGDEHERLSAHLSSRREVEGVLRARVPTTVLRAGIVIGDGGISWEILRQLVARLPVMVTPRWVQTRTQPVAIADAVAFLVGVLGKDEALGQVYEVGGPDVVTYGQMLELVGRMPGGVLRLILPVPLLSPRLSSHWLRLVTDVDLRTARALIDSMSNEVVVHDRRIEELTGHHAMGFREAAERALRDRANRLERVRPPDILEHSSEGSAVDEAHVVVRRRVVVVCTLVVGTAILAGTLAAPSGSWLFYLLGLLSAVTWITGSLLSGPILAPAPVRRAAGRLEIVVPILLGAALFGAFFAARLIADQVPILSGSVESVLARADAGPMALVLAVALVNGVGEEMFFRGALYSALGRNHPAVWSVATYCVVTAATLNLALVAAALVMGAVFSAERRATGRLLAPILTHLSWSSLVLFLLPR